MVEDDDEYASVAAELRGIAVRLAQMDADLTTFTARLANQPSLLEAAIANCIHVHGEAEAFEMFVTMFRRVAEQRPQHRTVQ